MNLTELIAVCKAAEAFQETHPSSCAGCPQAEACEKWLHSTGGVLCHVLAGLREMGVKGA